MGMLNDEELSGTERLKLQSLLAMATGECTFASLATEYSAALGQLNGKDVLQPVEFTSELSRRSQPLASFLWRNLSKRTRDSFSRSTQPPGQLAEALAAELTQLIRHVSFAREIGRTQGGMATDPVLPLRRLPARQIRENLNMLIKAYPDYFTEPILRTLTKSQLQAWIKQYEVHGLDELLRWKPSRRRKHLCKIEEVLWFLAGIKTKFVVDADSAVEWLQKRGISMTPPTADRFLAHLTRSDVMAREDGSVADALTQTGFRHRLSRSDSKLVEEARKRLKAMLEQLAMESALMK
jgi:hypothetical protein